MSLAGWCGGVFNAVKLLYSFSTSGPSATENPISPKIAVTSSMTCVTGWIFPKEMGLPGKVTSILSSDNFLLISFCSKRLILELIRLLILS